MPKHYRNVSVQHLWRINDVSDRPAAARSSAWLRLRLSARWAWPRVARRARRNLVARPAPAGGGGGGGTATMWGLTGKPGETIRKNTVDAFNKLGKGTIEVTSFQNDPYKAKIRTAIGAGQAPTLIFGWGGGILKSYADASQVDDLTSWIERDVGVQGQVPAVDVGCGDLRQEDLRRADPDHPADPHVLQQGAVREGRRATADDLGRRDEPRRRLQRPGGGPVLPWRPVEVDVDDVAGVPPRPRRRPRGVRRDLRQQGRTHGRIRR